MESSNNLILPKDEAIIDQWLTDNKDAVIAELKKYYEFCLNFCGEDDDINTIPAKELYEKATIDILSCNEDIQNHYIFLEECNKQINLVKSERTSLFSVVK